MEYITSLVGNFQPNLPRGTKYLCPTPTGVRVRAWRKQRLKVYKSVRVKVCHTCPEFGGNHSIWLTLPRRAKLLTGSGWKRPSVVYNQKLVCMYLPYTSLFELDIKHEANLMSSSWKLPSGMSMNKGKKVGSESLYIPAVITELKVAPPQISICGVRRISNGVILL